LASQPDLSGPLVSIIIPTVNRSSLLRETIVSVLAQSFQSFEVIVVSDGGTDNTAEVLSDFADPRIRFFQRPAAKRPAVPRNFGITQTRGKYVAFCDDDDLWVPDKLTRQVALMEADSAVALCSTTVRVRLSDGSEKASSGIRGGEINLRRLYVKNLVATSSVLVRAAVLRELGDFDEAPELAPYEDYEYWLRLVSRHRAILIPDDLVTYRIHGRNVTPARLRGIRLVFKILLSARQTIGAHGIWYWSCVVARWCQYTGLRIMCWLSVLRSGSR